MTIGKKIKRLRKERGMTQEELGREIGVQKAAINKYETGIVVNLKHDTIEKLARVLDVHPAWLVDESADFPPLPSSSSMIRQINHQYFGETVDTPQTPEARILANGIDQLSPEQRAQALAVVKAMFPQQAELFNE